jgi:hypothetical protein
MSLSEAPKYRASVPMVGRVKSVTTPTADHEHMHEHVNVHVDVDVVVIDFCPRSGFG